MNRPFKIGEVVLCVNDVGVKHQIRRGHYYMVTRVLFDGEIVFINDAEDAHFAADRFSREEEEDVTSR